MSTATLTDERRVELQEVIGRMRAVSKQFYGGAVHVGNHAFIEFTGLMNEYIQVCQHTLDAGVDFTETTKHGSGRSLKIAAHERAYLAEKLTCIFETSLPDLMKGKTP